MKRRRTGFVILGGVCAVIVALTLIVLGVYFTRIQSIQTIEKLTNYSDGYDLYKMDILYDYDLDGMLGKEYSDNQSVINAIYGTCLPLLPGRSKPKDFSCSTFCITDTEGDVLMGRNYDYHADTARRESPAGHIRRAGLLNVRGYSSTVPYRGHRAFISSKSSTSVRKNRFCISLETTVTGLSWAMALPFMSIISL